MQLPHVPRNLVPLKLKYLPRHSVLKHPQPTFLTRCDRPCFTPTKNKTYCFSTAYFDLYTFQSGEILLTER